MFVNTIKNEEGGVVDWNKMSRQALISSLSQNCEGEIVYRAIENRVFALALSSDLR